MRIFYTKALALCLMFATALVAGCSKNSDPKDPTPNPDPTPEPPKELVAGTFEVNVDEVLEDAITITITPSEEVDYYYACLASDTEKYLGGEEELIILDQLSQPNAEQLIFRGEQTLTFGGLIAHSHYRLLYFQYDSEKEWIFGDLMRSERITTPDGTEQFAIDVTNITGISADVKITPNDPAMSYFWWIEEMSQYDEWFDNSDNLLIQNDFGFWQYYADLEGLDWKEVMNWDLTNGVTEDSSDSLYNLLMWDNEYMVYVYGLDSEGNLLTQMTKEHFKTNPKPAAKDVTFDISIESTEWDVAFNKFAVSAKITPSDPEAKFYVTITNMSWYDWYFTSDNTGRSDEEYIQYQILLNASKQSWELLEDFRMQGETVYKPHESRNQYFSPNREYGVFVFGLDENGPTTPLKIYEFTTPQRPAQEE